MGDLNTLKNILLFAVRNDCTDVRLSIGKLPLIVTGNGVNKHINGILPIDKVLMEQISSLYLEQKERAIVTVGSKDFLVSKISDDISFRHLPFVQAIEATEEDLCSVSYNKRGIILVSSKSQEQRFYRTYAIAGYILNTRKTTMVVVETDKRYSLREGSSSITSIYDPNTELDILLRISDQIKSDAILIPDCSNENYLSSIEEIANNKLVILGTTPQIAKEIDPSNVLHLSSVSEHGLVSKRITTELKIDSSVIIKNLRGYKHA
ncbi:MAG: hypothetical protein WCQ47_02870 [bacterium]